MWTCAGAQAMDLELSVTHPGRSSATPPRDASQPPLPSGGPAHVSPSVFSAFHPLLWAAPGSSGLFAAIPHPLLVLAPISITIKNTCGSPRGLACPLRGSVWVAGPPLLGQWRAPGHAVLSLLFHSPASFKGRGSNWTSWLLSLELLPCFLLTHSPKPACSPSSWDSACL